MKTKFPIPSSVPLSGRFGACYQMITKYPSKGKVILDVGSSAGTMEYKISNLGFKKIIGIEPNRAAVEFSRKNVSGAEFHVSTADKLPVANGSVDIVSMFDVIEHVPINGEVDAFREVYRVLKKDGVLVLTTPNNNWITNLLDPAWYLGHRHYKPRDLTKLVEKAGLNVRKTEVKGDIWSSIYFIWLYISKWIFGKTLPRNSWIEMKENDGYKSPGIFTLFLEARKTC